MSTKDITSHHIYGTDIQQIANKMREISTELQEKAAKIGIEDKVALRKNPEIVNLWRKLCVLHMRGLIICEDTKYSNNACMYIKEPQVCQTVLGIPREETCCGRFFGLEEPTH
jgi:hypothetical protein